MLTIAQHTSLQAIMPLRTEWHALIERCEHASVFAKWEWVEAFCKFGVPGRQPFVLTARDNQGKLVGLLPLARIERLGAFSTLEVMGCTRDGYPITDYGGPIAIRGLESAVWQAMLKHLKQSRWAIIDLRNCSGKASNEGQAVVTANGVTTNLGWTSTVQTSDTCRLVPLPDSFDNYLSTLSSNTRQNLRRKLRKLKESGHTLDEVDVHDENARNGAMDALIVLHQQRWSKESGGGFPDERSCKLHKYVVDGLATTGNVDMRIVRSIEGKILGVIYNLRHNGVASFYSLGVTQDPEWTHLSLGVCLLADSIRAAIEAGCHTFDLLRGDHDYKAHFGGYTTNNLRVTIYRYSWLPKVEQIMRELRQMLRRSPAIGTGAQL